MTLYKNLKINLTNKIFISSAGFLLVIFFLIFLIVAPTIKDILAMGEEIESQRIDLEKKYLKGQSLRQLIENLNKIQPRLGLLDQVFINKNRELEFITSLENEAGKNRVSQKINLGAAQATGSNDFQKTDLQLLTKGGFNQQLQYLTNLESLNYYINVKQLEITVLAGENEARPVIRNSSSTPEKAKDINMYIKADTYWN